MFVVAGTFVLYPYDRQGGGEQRRSGRAGKIRKVDGLAAKKYSVEELGCVQAMISSPACPSREEDNLRHRHRAKSCDHQPE
jgi:hypothetical protein